MNHFTRIISLSCLLFFYGVKSNAQHRIQVPNIDFIAYEDDAFLLYEKVGEDSFKEIDVYVGDTDKQFSTVKIDQDGYAYSLAQVKSEYENIIWIDALESNSFENFKHTEWELTSPEIEKNERILLKFSDHDFAAYYELESLEEQNLTASEWEIIDLMWYQPIILDFGNGKEIILFGDGSYDIDFTIIPVSGRSPIMLTDGLEIDEMIPIQKNTYYMTKLDEFYDFEFADMYQQIKDGDQLRLYDYFGNDLLGNTFDRIEYNNYFIITENKGNYTVYDPLLNTLRLPQILQYQLHNYALEIVTENGIFYVDVEGNLLQEFPYDLRFEAVRNYPLITYTIETDLQKKYPYSIKAFDARNNYRVEYEHTFELIDLPKKYTLTFLDTSTDSHHWKKPQQHLNAALGLPEYIKIQQGNSFGIMHLEFDKKHKKAIKKTPIANSPRTRYVFTETQVKATKALPVKFDNIQMMDGMIVFSKNNTFGIFPRDTKPQYEYFEKASKSFFTFVKNGKKGWLNVHTLEEYFLD